MFSHNDVKPFNPLNYLNSVHHLSCKKLFLVSAAASSSLCCGFIGALNLTVNSSLTCMR